MLKDLRQQAGIKWFVFRQNLKKLRKAMGCSQSEFAGMTGLREGLIHSLESKAARRTPTLETAIIIAEACGVTVEALTGVSWELNDKRIALLESNNIKE